MKNFLSQYFDRMRRRNMNKDILERKAESQKAIAAAAATNTTVTTTATTVTTGSVITTTTATENNNNVSKKLEKQDSNLSQIPQTRQEKWESAKKLARTPEYTLVFLIHLLSHHPDFDERAAKRELYQFSLVLLCFVLFV